MGVIRFILAISVVIAHTSPLHGFGLVGGEMAVKLFFIISGFYMALILNEKYIEKNSKYSVFIKNRFLRIYPLYLLVLFLTVGCNIAGYNIRPDLGTAVTQFMEYQDAMRPSSVILLSTVNVSLIGIESTLFLGLESVNGSLFFTPDFSQTVPKVHSFLFVPQAWSISIELTFYLIAPFICRNLKTIITLLIMSAAIALLLFLLDLPNDPWNYRFFPSQLVYFMLGSAGYFLYRKIKTHSRVYLNWSALLIILLITIFYSQLQEIINSTLLDAVTILLYSIGVPLVFILSKSWKKDRFIGELSYSIYLVHMLIIYLVHLSGFSRVFVFGFNEIVIILTIASCVLIQKLFIERVEKFRVIPTN